MVSRLEVKDVKTTGLSLETCMDETDLRYSKPLSQSMCASSAIFELKVSKGKVLMMQKVFYFFMWRCFGVNKSAAFM